MNLKTFNIRQTNKKDGLREVSFCLIVLVEHRGCPLIQRAISTWNVVLKITLQQIRCCWDHPQENIKTFCAISHRGKYTTAAAYLLCFAKAFLSGLSLLQQVSKVKIALILSIKSHIGLLHFNASIHFLWLKDSAAFWFWPLKVSEDGLHLI